MEFKIIHEEKGVTTVEFSGTIFPSMNSLIEIVGPDALITSVFVRSSNTLVIYFQNHETDGEPTVFSEAAIYSYNEAQLYHAKQLQFDQNEAKANGERKAFFGGLLLGVVVTVASVAIGYALVSSD